MNEKLTKNSAAECGSDELTCYIAVSLFDYTGNILKPWRDVGLRMRWSLARLAEYLEVNVATVHRIEHGKSPVRRPTKIAMRELNKEAVKIEEINKRLG